MPTRASLGCKIQKIRNPQIVGNLRLHASEVLEDCRECFWLRIRDDGSKCSLSGSIESVDTLDCRKIVLSSSRRSREVLHEFKLRH